MIINKINNNINFTSSKKIKKQNNDLKPKKDNENLLLLGLGALAMLSGAICLKPKVYKLACVKFIDGVAYIGKNKFTGIIEDTKKNNIQIKYVNGLPKESKVFDSNNNLILNKVYQYFPDNSKAIIVKNNNPNIEKRAVFGPKNSTFSLLRQDFKNGEITEIVRLDKNQNTMRRVYDNGVVLDAYKINNSWEKEYNCVKDYYNNIGSIEDKNGWKFKSL